jgi:hypothetical protein
LLKLLVLAFLTIKVLTLPGSTAMKLAETTSVDISNLLQIRILSSPRYSSSFSYSSLV